MAARTKSGEFIWEPPDAIEVRDYNGEMIQFGGRSLDLLVVPAQRMLWTREGNSRAKERVDPAREIEGKDGARLVATSSWSAPDVEQKVFQPLSRATRGPAARDFSMTGDQYAAFMGMYLAEGCAFHTDRDWRVLISQTLQGKGYGEYRELLAQVLGHEPGRSGESWSFCSRALAQNLITLGKRASTKCIPSDVLNMSRRQLEIFWRYYWLGDGCYATGGQEVVATASPTMAGQLQEVIQKLGWSASVREAKSAPTSLVNRWTLVYKLGVRKTAYPEYKTSRLPHAGRVVHVHVPSGVTYVRRNGRVVWAGV